MLGCACCWCLPCARCAVSAVCCLLSAVYVRGRERESVCVRVRESEREWETDRLTDCVSYLIPVKSFSGKLLDLLLLYLYNWFHIHIHIHIHTHHPPICSSSAPSIQQWSHQLIHPILLASVEWLVHCSILEKWAQSLDGVRLSRMREIKKHGGLLSETAA